MKKRAAVTKGKKSNKISKHAKSRFKDICIAPGLRKQPFSFRAKLELLKAHFCLVKTLGDHASRGEHDCDLGCVMTEWLQEVGKYVTNGPTIEIATTVIVPENHDPFSSQGGFGTRHLMMHEVRNSLLKAIDDHRSPPLQVNITFPFEDDSAIRSSIVRSCVDQDLNLISLVQTIDFQKWAREKLHWHTFLHGPFGDRDPADDRKAPLNMDEWRSLTTRDSSNAMMNYSSSYRKHLVFTVYVHKSFSKLARPPNWRHRPGGDLLTKKLLFSQLRKLFHIMPKSFLEFPDFLPISE